MTAPALLGLRFLCGLGILAMGPTVFWDLLRQQGLIGNNPDARETLEASMAAWLLTCLAVVGFAAWQRPGWPWRPARAGRVAATYLPFLLAWVGVLVGYLALARGCGFVVPPQPALEYLAAGDCARPGFWLVVAGTTLGAPLAEEIVFRGYLQCALGGVLRPVWAIAVTASLFGTVHTLPYAFPVALLGACFGWLAMRSGSLWPAVLGHALHNSCTVAITVFWPASLTLLYPR